MTIAKQLRQEGEEKGRIEGIKEGERQNSREMSKKFLLLNMDKKQIIEVIGLSVAEIE